MANIIELCDEDLEEAGYNIFENMGLSCIYPLNQVRILEIDPDGPHGADDHLEIDFLIPYREYCLIGEITGRTNERRVRRKYRRFRNHLNILRNSEINDNFWNILGVPDDRIRWFREIQNLVGFFITNRFEEYDLDLEAIPIIGRFYQSDCALLEEYAECIGAYSKYHFLRLFDINEDRGHRPLEINREDHNLITSTDKQIVSGDVPRSDIYTFEINPYDILQFAHVYRRDELPCLTSGEDHNFQRPLIPTKINQIRNNLLNDPDFMFPNSILAVLSDECRYDENAHSLMIPQTFESISIIDGQHRLFSYANADVENGMDEACRIIVTAIMFEGADAEDIRLYSAKAFVEINRNQTGIQRKHLDAIAYDLLGETDGRALAAKILFDANNRRRHSLFGLFETNKMLTGKLKATTIISSLRPIANINEFQRLARVREGSSRDILRNGYLHFYGVENIEDLTDPETIIYRGTIGVIRYFDIVRNVFAIDWPEPGVRKNSSLEYAKVIAGFVRLLRQFISEGATWEIIHAELEAICTNLLELREMTNYDAILLDPSHPDIPDSNPRDSEDFRFFHNNRIRPTSIEEILE